MEQNQFLNNKKHPVRESFLVFLMIIAIIALIFFLIRKYEKKGSYTAPVVVEKTCKEFIKNGEFYYTSDMNFYFKINTEGIQIKSSSRDFKYVIVYLNFFDENGSVIKNSSVEIDSFKNEYEYNIVFKNILNTQESAMTESYSLYKIVYKGEIL